ncbi:hypothetical protein BDV97DRAFT_31367 [Delphinella strobiligena]|nr:hypothetical protein BDV97DRAFT_31367 [Delphinella strobiligena]
MRISNKGKKNGAKRGCCDPNKRRQQTAINAADHRTRTRPRRAAGRMVRIDEETRAESLESSPPSKGLPPSPVVASASELLLVEVAAYEYEVVSARAGAEVSAWRMLSLLLELTLLEVLVMLAFCTEPVVLEPGPLVVAVDVDVSINRPLVVKEAALNTIVPSPIDSVSSGLAEIVVELCLADAVTVALAELLLPALGQILRMPLSWIIALMMLSPEASLAHETLIEADKVWSAATQVAEQAPALKSAESQPSISEVYKVSHAEGRLESRGVKSSRETAEAFCKARANAAAESRLICGRCIVVARPKLICDLMFFMFWSLVGVFSIAYATAGYDQVIRSAVIGRKEAIGCC